MGNKKRALIVGVLFLVASPLVFASRFDKELSQRRRELKQIKNEIESQKLEAKKLAQKEVGTLESLNQLRQDIENSQRVLEVLEQTKSALNGSINENSQMADSLSIEIASGKKRLAEKVVYLYKHGEPDYAARLVKAESQSEWLEEYVYLKSLLESDRRLITRLHNQKSASDSLHSLLLSRRQSLLENERQKKKQREILNKKAKEEKEMLARLQGNRELLEKAVLEYESHQKILLGLIERLEKKRKEELARAKAHKDQQAKAKTGLGKICSPVKGKIVSEYGFHMHPDLKTKTKNLGIEIESSSKAKVKAARDGVIAQIVDLPAKGLSIIIDHGDSFYSVYGRLSGSKVQVGQKVSSCEEIANIGSQRGDSKPTLFFQVSKGVKTLDPRNWLRNAQ